jgi:hypothetical protein
MRGKANPQLRALEQSLSAKYGLPLKQVRKHIELFTRPIPEYALMCLIKDMRPKSEVTSGD